MVKYSLNELFGSLSDETRRDILKRLLSGEQTVSQLADAYEMSLPAVSKHVKALETAGMIIKEKRGRQWFVRLPSNAFKGAAKHLLHYEATLHNRLDSFAAYVQRSPETEQHKAVSGSSADEQQAIVITEVLNVDPEAAWHAYTDPASVKQWWNLAGAQVVKIENDVRVGDNWRFTVRGYDGHEYVLSGTYSVVEYPHQLEYTDGIGDSKNQPRPEARVTITFERLADGKTLLTKRSVATPAVHQLNASWYQAIGGG